MTREITDDEITMLLKAAGAYLTGMATGPIIKVPCPSRMAYTNEELTPGDTCHTKEYSIRDLVNGLFKVVAQQSDIIGKHTTNAWVAGFAAGKSIRKEGGEEGI